MARYGPDEQSRLLLAATAMRRQVLVIDISDQGTTRKIAAELLDSLASAPAFSRKGRKAIPEGVGVGARSETGRSAGLGVLIETEAATTDVSALAGGSR